MGSLGDLFGTCEAALGGLLKNRNIKKVLIKQANFSNKVINQKEDTLMRIVLFGLELRLDFQISSDRASKKK